jgi:clan AA aspartic protease (TIGR02281 family)
MGRFALGVLLLLLASSAPAETVQMQPHAGGYLISGQVNGAISLDFVLDTGASEVSIPEEAAQALVRAGALTAGDFNGTGTYVLADGSRVRSKRVTLRELRVGDQTVAGVTASIGPVGSRPLLGQSFLSRFPSWMLDNQRHVLVLSDGREAAEPTASAQSSPARLAGAPPYASFGAFGYDETTGRYGYSWNEKTQQLADEEALKGCGSDTCKVVFRTGPGECGAIAMTGNGKVWGGARRPRRDAAESAAVENCQKRTSSQCRLSGSKCNQ